MAILTRVGGFGSRDLHHTLSEIASQSFSESDRLNARLFVKLNQAAIHILSIGCTGRIIIGYPVNENFNTNTKFFAILPGF